MFRAKIAEMKLRSIVLKIIFYCFKVQRLFFFINNPYHFLLFLGIAGTDYMKTV